MKKHFFKIVSLFALAIALHMPAAEVQAQCPMCRMSAESNLKDGGKAGRGLNTGILFMLVTPYLLVGTIGFIWWRNRKKEEEVEADMVE